MKNSSDSNAEFFCGAADFFGAQNAALQIAMQAKIKIAFFIHIKYEFLKTNLHSKKNFLERAKSLRCDFPLKLSAILNKEEFDFLPKLI